ncbi:hypothetical protein K8Z49_23315 [Actinomadura madurae]|uniref:hypothetical protein n=1 Tax=Actinomadura madurae TaxID=1993 RepID=UPI00399C1B89
MRNTGGQGTTISLPSPHPPLHGCGCGCCAPRPRRLRIRGPAGARVVRPTWFDSLPSGLLTAIHADGRRVSLFTVPVSVATGGESPRETSSPANRPIIRPSGYSAPAYL